MNNVLPKWLVAALGGLLVIFVAMLVVQKGSELGDKFKNKRPANTLTVSAEGKVPATPDLATMSVGVTSQGTSAKDVQSKNNDKVNQIIDFVKGQGVPKEDITTSQFYASPQYDYQSGMKITGYQTTQIVTIKVRGIDKSQDKLNSIMGGVVENGSNTLNGVSFGFDDPDNLKQEARKLAIAKAKVKAQELAKEAGLNLGKVISVSENGGYYPGPMPYATDSFQSMGAGAANQMKAIAPSVEPGSQDITQTMTVVFEVK